MAHTDPLSIRQLEVFVALVEKGSFTKAARHLGLSQSTVSGHVADLERRLDVRLVERERSGVRPTAAGRTLLRPAREVLSAERTARMAVAELSGLLRGRLVVGGSTIPSSYLLPKLFGRFHDAHPAVSLRLVTGDSRDILARVRSADVEVGVVGAPPGGGDLDSGKIASDHLVLVVPNGHALTRKATAKVAELLDHRLVMREEGSGTRAATEGALGELLGEEAERLEVACEVGSTEAVKAAVREGLGVAFVSDLAVRDELEQGVLAKVRVRGFDVARDFHVVTRREEFLSPAAMAFRELALGR